MCLLDLQFKYHLSIKYKCGPSLRVGNEKDNWWIIQAKCLLETLCWLSGFVEKDDDINLKFRLNLNLV